LKTETIKKEKEMKTEQLTEGKEIKMAKYIAQQMTVKSRRLLDKLCKKSMRSRPKELEHVLIKATQEKK
jgi:hypothetical protein